MTNQGPPTVERAVVFGAFRLLPAQRLLLEGDRTVRLGNRALDLLAALVEQAGKTVRKDELIARAWPDAAVDEASLRVHIAALRKTLGDGRSGSRFIANVQGRGYVFVAPTKHELVERSAALPIRGEGSRGNGVPASLTRIVGRDALIAELAELITRRRLLTIVGPGGIGKTSVAGAVAEAAQAAFADGVWYAGLASLQDPELVPDTVGNVLGIAPPADNAVAGVTTWLRDRQALIVLDNCEHLIGAAAGLAEAIIRSAPRSSVLATSREPLRVQGEVRHRLGPLKCPPGAANIVAGDALKYSAVQLFNERASAVADGFAINDDDFPAMVGICRRLDGMPLALELAAAHVAAFGVKGLLARLDDCLPLLMRGRRTALPRHHTLRATFDWSHDLLPGPEQAVFRRLAAFHGYFTMHAAIAVAAQQAITADQVVTSVANLVDKSLVAADISGAETYYHLLEMTRAYALEKLQESGEYDRMKCAHAQVLPTVARTSRGHDFVTFTGRTVQRPYLSDRQSPCRAGLVVLARRRYSDRCCDHGIADASLGTDVADVGVQALCRAGTEGAHHCGRQRHSDRDDAACRARGRADLHDGTGRGDSSGVDNDSATCGTPGRHGIPVACPARALVASHECERV